MKVVFESDDGRRFERRQDCLAYERTQAEIKLRREGVDTRIADLRLRWMIRRDMPEVMAIERASFEYAWTEEEMLDVLRQRNGIGMVAENAGGVQGFMLYELKQKQLRLLNIAVAPDVRRQGIGSRLVLRLIDKLSQQRRTQLRVLVRETNVVAQLFFRSLGFQAHSIDRQPFTNCDEDGYELRFTLPAQIGGESHT